MSWNQLKRADRPAVGSIFERFMTRCAVQNVFVAAFEPYLADFAFALIEGKNAFGVEALLIVLRE